jgi:solute carrier family 35, member E3
MHVWSNVCTQILCGYYQRIHGITSHQLMSNTSYFQGMILLILGPFMDRAVTHMWIQVRATHAAWAP